MPVSAEVTNGRNLLAPPSKQGITSSLEPLKEPQAWSFPMSSFDPIDFSNVYCLIGAWVFLPV